MSNYSQSIIFNHFHIPSYLTTSINQTIFYSIFLKLGMKTSLITIIILFI